MSFNENFSEYNNVRMETPLNRILYSHGLAWKYEMLMTTFQGMTSDEMNIFSLHTKEMKFVDGETMTSENKVIRTIWTEVHK